MKTTMTNRFRGFLAAVLTASAAFRSSAEDAPSAMGPKPAATPEKNRTGTVISTAWPASPSA